MGRRRAWEAADAGGRAPYSCISGSGPNAAKTSSRSESESLSRVSSSWLRTNVAHCDSPGDGRTLTQGTRQRASVLTGHRQVEVLHPDEVELHRQLVAVPAAEERLLVLVRQVHLAEQNPVAGTPAHERPQVPQKLMGVGEAVQLRLVHAGGLDHERHGIHPEARDAQLQPEAHRLDDLVTDARIGDIEVGLGPVETVQIPLGGLLVVLPDAVLLVGEGHLLAGVRRLLGAPDIEVAVRRSLTRSRRPEPRVLVGGVVDDQVDDHPHPAVTGGPDHLDEVPGTAQARVNAVVVGDVVAIVAVRRRMERHQPQAGHPQLGEVVEALDQAREVAHPIVVPIHKRLHVQAVNDRRLPPQVTGVTDPHPHPLRAQVRTPEHHDDADATSTGCRLERIHLMAAAIRVSVFVPGVQELASWLRQYRGGRCCNWTMEPAEVTYREPSERRRFKYGCSRLPRAGVPDGCASPTGSLPIGLSGPPSESPHRSDDFPPVTPPGSAPASFRWLSALLET